MPTIRPSGLTASVQAFSKARQEYSHKVFALLNRRLPASVGLRYLYVQFGILINHNNEALKRVVQDTTLGG
jgi:hypothetical protein